MQVIRSGRIVKRAYSVRMRHVLRSRAAGCALRRRDSPHADRQSVVLREAQAVGAGQQGKNVPVDGEVLLFAEDIAYVQFP